MRLLLDESVPAGLRNYLPSHSVTTVTERGWSGEKNGELLRLSATDFDTLITVDKNLPHQQNLKSLPISVVILDAHSNKLSALLPLVPSLLLTLNNMKPKTLARVSA